MRESLGDLFLQSGSSSIVLDGRRIYSAVDLIVPTQTKLRIKLISKNSRDQALCVDARQGVIHVEGSSASSMIFWTNTAPPSFDLRVQEGRHEKSMLRLWNAWRGTREVTHAGIGNAGILLTRTSDGVRLSCSNGWGPINFDDLVVDLAVPGQRLEVSSPE